MGKKKHTRILIAGQLRTVAGHQAKIKAERQKATPNIDSIKGWEREIDIARKKLRKLEQRLEK